MNPLYQAALEGTLRSSSGGAPVIGDGAKPMDQTTVTNTLPIALLIYAIDSDGAHHYQCTVSAGGQFHVPTAKLSTTQYYLAKTQATGSFVCVIAFAIDKYTLRITPAMLTTPGAIGKYRAPTRDIMIPPNSPMVLVGCGVGPPAPQRNAAVVLREQYWCRQPDSFALAAHESKTSSISVSRGLQDTSSNTETVAASLGVSGSAGWGPISASLNASLNASATFFHQVTVTEQTSVYESKTFTNTADHSVMYFAWQLVDVVTILADGVVAATLSVGEPPTIISGPFDPDALPGGSIEARDLSRVVELPPQATPVGVGYAEAA